VRLPNTIDGGAYCINDNYLFEIAKQTRDLGIDRAIFRDSLGEISKACDISVPGYGATLSDVNSYIGCLQMEKIEELINKHKINAKKWEDKIRMNYPDFVIMKKDFQNPNYWIFGLLAPYKKKAINQFRELGFYASGVHLPNNSYSVFGKQQELPGVNDFYSKFVALPCGWWCNY